ncbi:DUF5133 domain-containing protein [Streptomyces sp. CBMA29]|uniref:DUF5133 domain-containing protein n=1 Tax=Streptomyces sp. CBMA29 TaxID=1896314 RepID=UPI001661AF5E|nr:DUF5133 domain-containing protein [Streptomyces sp. CBMA29]MBD0735347.1 hypothetical protein [Streptomyces sp. CBMA29]
MSAHPAALRELVERYEHLNAQSPEVRSEPRIRDLLRDTAYTLCVATGTGEIGAALAAARALLAEAGDAESLDDEAPDATTALEAAA